MLNELQHCPIHIPIAILSWAEARVKIARMTLTIKLDGNWSSFQLANSAPPLSVTDSAIAPSARMILEQFLTQLYQTHPLPSLCALAFNDLPEPYSNHPLLSVAVGA